MTIRLLSLAVEDLRRGREFYDHQGTEVGDYFLECLHKDLRSLSVTRGVHSKKSGFYRAIAERFPFAIYYDIEGGRVDIWRILDMRSNPKRIEAKLRLTRKRRDGG